EVRRLQCKRPIYAIAFSPAGKMLASGGSAQPERLGPPVVTLWDPNGKELRTLTSHDGSVYSLSFSPDCKQVAGGGRDSKTVTVWDVTTGKAVSQIETGAPVEVVLFAPDGKGLLSAGRGGVIHWWDSGTGKEKNDFKEKRMKFAG